MENKEFVLKRGQVLITNQDIKLQEVETGKEIIIKEGSKAIVGFDDILHYYNGSCQEISEEIEISGISPNGLAEFVIDCLVSRFPVNEMLEDFQIPIDDFHKTIVEALNGIGIYEEKN